MALYDAKTGLAVSTNGDTQTISAVLNAGSYFLKFKGDFFWFCPVVSIEFAVAPVNSGITITCPPGRYFIFTCFDSSPFCPSCPHSLFNYLLADCCVVETLLPLPSVLSRSTLALRAPVPKPPISTPPTRPALPLWLAILSASLPLDSSMLEWSPISCAGISISSCTELEARVLWSPLEITTTTTVSNFRDYFSHLRNSEANGNENIEETKAQKAKGGYVFY